MLLHDPFALTVSVQEQYVRCMRACEDRVAQRLPEGVASVPDHLQADLLACASACSTEYAALVPAMFERLNKLFA